MILVQVLNSFTININTKQTNTFLDNLPIQIYPKKTQNQKSWNFFFFHTCTLIERLTVALCLPFCNCLIDWIFSQMSRWKLVFDFFESASFICQTRCEILKCKEDLVWRVDAKRQKGLNRALENVFLLYANQLFKKTNIVSPS